MGHRTTTEPSMVELVLIAGNTNQPRDVRVAAIKQLSPSHLSYPWVRQQLRRLSDPGSLEKVREVARALLAQYEE